MKKQLISASTQLPVHLSEIRDLLKISHQDEDALLVTYCRAAAQACEIFTGRQLLTQQWQVTLNDWRAREVQIPLSPVQSVDKIEIWNGSIFQLIDATTYLLDNTSYQARILPQPAYQWTDPARETGGIKITVTAGFGDDQNALPHDLRLGLLLWISAAYDGGLPGGNQSAALAEKLWQPYRRMVL